MNNHPEEEMKTCSVAGCGKPERAKGFCSTHYDRVRRNGDPLTMQRSQKGTGNKRPRGDQYMTVAGRHVFRHVLLAEAVIGRRLPHSACVHHADENPSNDSPGNLVVCPDQAYHSLLHRRTRALNECGNANWRKCRRCGIYDSPENVSVYGGEAVHPECNRAHVAKHKREKMLSAGDLDAGVPL